MLAPGMSIFVRLPSIDGEESSLQPAVVTEKSGETCTIELLEPDETPRPGEDISLFFDVQGRFSEQSGRVQRALDERRRCFVGVLLAGESSPAENRQSFRVSTATGGEVMASLNGGRGCAVLDVSYTGFAVSSDRSYEVGASVTVTIQFQGNSYAGSAVIKSARELLGGQTRYGMHVSPGRGTNALQKGLQSIASAIQRKQLQRLARGS